MAWVCTHEIWGRASFKALIFWWTHFMTILPINSRRPFYNLCKITFQQEKKSKHNLIHSWLTYCSHIHNISYHFTFKNIKWVHKRSLHALSSLVSFCRNVIRIGSKIIQSKIIKKLVKMFFRATKHLKKSNTSGISKFFRFKHVSSRIFLYIFPLQIKNLNWNLFPNFSQDVLLQFVVKISQYGSVVHHLILVRFGNLSRTMLKFWFNRQIGERIPCK